MSDVNKPPVEAGADALAIMRACAGFYGPKMCRSDYVPAGTIRIDQCEAIAALVDKLAAERDALAEKLANVEAVLRSPEAVHVALLRGDIAKPDIRNMLHVYGQDAVARWDSVDALKASHEAEMLGLLQFVATSGLKYRVDGEVVMKPLAEILAAYTAQKETPNG